MADIESLKKEAGIEACKYVKTGMKVGLGTGSTVKHTVIELGRRIMEEGLEIIGVPTSIATENLAIEVGIPLAELSDLNELDIVIDGADEFDPNFQLIKGGGAALLREKIVAQASKKMVVVADERKEVAILGNFPLPIEITQFSHKTTINQIKSRLSCEATLRMLSGKPLVTDNGNYIVDAATGPAITNPKLTESDLLDIAGVVQVGLFNDMCDVVILASSGGVKTLIK